MDGIDFFSCFTNSVSLTPINRTTNESAGFSLPFACFLQSIRIRWILLYGTKTNAMVHAHANGWVYITAFHQSTRMGSTPRRNSARDKACESMGKDTLGIVWREQLKASFFVKHIKQETVDGPQWEYIMEGLG